MDSGDESGQFVEQKAMQSQAETSLRLIVVPHEVLTEAEIDAIIELCSAAFEGPMDEFIHQHTGGAHVLAKFDGVLVGHASWVLRELQPAGLPLLQTAYVEDVATHPAYQGRGVGTAVMRQMAELIKDFELGGLATGKFGFYARLGWEMWRGKTAIRTEQGLLETPDEGVMILRLARTPPLDLDALITAEWRPGEAW